MELHPKLKAMVDMGIGKPPMHTLAVEAVRATDDIRYAPVPRDPVASVEDRTIPGPRGEMHIRIYRPNDATNLPVIVFFHGSGFVICSVDTHDGLCRQLCLRSDMVVVSVDYALAPEQKFPAAPDDCLAATQWVMANAAGFGGDTSRIIVAGDSAGGNLATVTAMRLRDQGAQMPAAQLLMYPVTDHPSANHPSYTERAEGFGLSAAGMNWFWEHYLQDSRDGDHPMASPNRADDLTGMPPTYLITAGYDPLRDEGRAYAQRLRASGNAVTFIEYGNANHGFMSWVGLIDLADSSVQAACDWLKDTLGA